MANPSTSNAFAILGLPPRFDLESSAIERAFFEKSKELHPDKVPAAERVAALSRSRALNDAYQVIKKPIPRAEALLAAEGVTIGDHERMPLEFLQHHLEQREALEEAKAAGQTAEIERLQGEMTARRKELLAGITTDFAALTAALDRAPVLARIKQKLIELRYIARYLEATDEALGDD